jgi:hypothetical protein
MAVQLLGGVRVRSECPAMKLHSFHAVATFS